MTCSQMPSSNSQRTFLQYIFFRSHTIMLRKALVKVRVTVKPNFNSYLTNIKLAFKQKYHTSLQAYGLDEFMYALPGKGFDFGIQHRTAHRKFVADSACV